MSELDVFADVPGKDLADMSFDEILAASPGGVFSIPGTELVDKPDLLGIPFIITKLTFQPVAEPTAKVKNPTSFVSIEATVADEARLMLQIQRRKVPNVDNIDQLMFEPGARIVFNDGSTGVYRQLVTLLATYGIITLPDAGSKEAEYGDITNVYDLPWTKWISCSQMDTLKEDGEARPVITNNQNGDPFRLVCRRGLYVSTYTNEFGESQTFYLK